MGEKHWSISRNERILAGERITLEKKRKREEEGGRKEKEKIFRKRRESRCKTS